MSKKRKTLMLATIMTICFVMLVSPVRGSDSWELKAYTGCTNENQFEHQCLPNVSNVEAKLDALHEDLVGMDKDKHTWASTDTPVRVRPGDNWPFDGKRHVQSIQYYGYEGNRYIITSLSDEHNDEPAVQIIKTKQFGEEEGGTDTIVYQSLLSDYEEWSRFNHPGGSQLIGNYLFLALEDFGSLGDPATGVWYVDGEQTWPWFQVPTTDIPGGDHHQSTAAVTKLADGTYLLATCVGPDGCDNINFYKSAGNDLMIDRAFTFIDTWNRNDEPPLGLPSDGNNWDECAPQNMNMVAQDDGTIYLVMFGAVNRGVQTGDLGGCTTGAGYDDHLFAYKLEMDEDYEFKLSFTNKVDVMPESHMCAKTLLAADPAKELHGLNFLAGSGLWLRPDGRDTIAFLATEHYDTCGANDRYLGNGEGVRAKTRWGVSSNWNQLQLITIDNSEITVDEGQTALNTGNYFQYGDVTLSASVGSIVPNGSDWSWSWPTTDGPDDSQEVEVAREGSPFPTDSKTFDLIVNNVPPTADAGLDQVVECVSGLSVSLDATGSTDPGDDTLAFAWTFTAVPGGTEPSFDDAASATPSFQPQDLGTYEALVTVTDDDLASGTDNVSITFEDTTPPVISSVSSIPNVLWPPNHKMVPVEVRVSATDACDEAPVCSIISIESSEPDDGMADSNITGDLTAYLRAERLGTGSSRVYTMVVECTDTAGNSATETTIVTVPHD